MRYDSQRALAQDEKDAERENGTSKAVPENARSASRAEIDIFLSVSSIDKRVISDGSVS
jgi:hypothetical protein